MKAIQVLSLAKDVLQFTIVSSFESEDSTGLDTGAEITVNGLEQAKACIEFMCIASKALRRWKKFKIRKDM